MDKPFLRNDLVEVRQSSRHGYGLFAKTSIVANTQLGQCKTIPTAKGDEDGLYVMWLDDDGDHLVTVLCDLRFINHGRPANVSYYDDLSVCTLRDIKAGEELLHDYGDAW